MSRSTFLTSSPSSSFDASENNSISNNNSASDHTHVVRFHHRLMPTISTSNRSNETLPVLLVQSSTANTTPLKTVAHLNPKAKRNLRGKRRSTGIRPDDVSLASSMNEMNINDDGEDDDKNTSCSSFITISSQEPVNESFDQSPPKPVFKVSRVQPTFDENSRHPMEKLSITRTDPFTMTPAGSISVGKMFRPEEFILRRQTSDDEPSSIKRRSIEERIRALESLNFEKDSIIHDLQRKLDQKTRDLNEAEQQIFSLQRDKLTLIKTLTSLQDPKASISGTDISIRAGFLSRN